jgi:hypothetical protein
LNGGDGDLLGGEWRRLPRCGGGLGLVPPRPPRWSRYLCGRDEPRGGGGGGGREDGGGGGERLRFRLGAGGPPGGGGGSCGERSSGLSGGGGGGRRARGASEAGSSTSAIRAAPGLGFGTVRAESSRVEQLETEAEGSRETEEMGRLVSVCDAADGIV